VLSAEGPTTLLGLFISSASHLHKFFTSQRYPIGKFVRTLKISRKGVVKMKNILFFLAGALVAAVVLAGVGFAYAQTQNPPNQAPGYSGGMMGGGRGFGLMGGGRGQASDFEGPMHVAMVASLAEGLDMTPEALQAELDAGKTAWQVAQEKGLGLDDFRTLMDEAHDKALGQAVADGILTQEQADWMGSRMDQAQANGFGAGNGPCGGMGFSNWGGGRGGRWNTQPTPAP
jgi:hypothetical protein